MVFFFQLPSGYSCKLAVSEVKALQGIHSVPLQIIIFKVVMIFLI